ncbi:proline-rich basic protein 1 [Rhynchocyon petersi]
MLTALVPPALPGLPGLLRTTPARRQDSWGSSGSYHTAPSTPEPPDLGPDGKGPESWPGVAPAPGAGAQPRLSVSAQNSRQQPRLVSGFPRGPGSGPRPPQPQLRTLPSGEMEVIFSAGSLFGPSDVADREVQQLTAARAFQSLSPPGPATSGPDGGARWATYLELRPGGPSPTASAQFECVEVALDESAAPAKPRTVPKRQIELRPRPRSPQRAAGAQRPPILVRTGSLDESLSRLQAAAGLVQTALARKLSAAPPALSKGPCARPERPEPASRDTAGGPRVLLQEDKSRPPRAQDCSAPARAPRPWPSLRERAIRRDKPPPGTEPLGPVSSSIFLQSEERLQEAHHHHRELQVHGARGTPDLARNPPSQAKPAGAAQPRSSSPPREAPNGALRGPRCPPPQALSPWDQAVRRVRSPPVPEAARETQNPVVEETVGKRSPSPPKPSRCNQAVARAGSPSLQAAARGEVPHSTVRNQAVGRGCLAPQTVLPWEAPERPTEESWGLFPEETWPPTVQRSWPGTLNGAAEEEQAPSTPSTPGTPELTEACSPTTRELLALALRDNRPSPEVAASEPPRTPASALGVDQGPEALGPGEAAPERPRVAIPRPRDVRKMVKTTYAPSFPAKTPSLGPQVSPVDPSVEIDDTAKTQELEVPGSPTQAHYTSIFRKDFLPIVPHPYEPSGPPLIPDTDPRDTAQPNGVPRRRAENNTAKPFARAEIRLPGGLTSGRRAETILEEARRLVPDESPRSPPGVSRPALQCSPVQPEQSLPSRPPRPGSPQAHPISTSELPPKLEPLPAAHHPVVAMQPALPPETQASVGRTAPAQPRAASAPPMGRSPESPSQGIRRPPGASHHGKVLVDPESGRCYYVEAPQQPRLRLLFDPESGQYVEVLLPPSPPGPLRRVYTPLALGSSLYPPAYGPISGLSVPSSPGLQTLSSPQIPWASEVGPLEGMYYLPVSGTPSPAPLLLCAPPSSSVPAQKGKDSLFPV